MPEKLGRRVAALRADRGWTQQQLADRLAVSRVAVSHLESGLTDPGERTVALLAGIFRLEPHDLVSGTSYPAAKAERLPVVVARWTEAEHLLAMLGRDLEWSDRTAGRHDAAMLDHWTKTLLDALALSHDPEERRLLGEALQTVRTRNL